MTESQGPPPPPESRVRQTLIRVIVIQVVALTFLGFLQLYYTP